MNPRLLTGISALVMLVCAVGCTYQPSGGLMAGSNTPFTYYSTAEYPKTFVVVDTRNGDNIFEMHIPPGKALVVKFVKGQGDDAVETPDIMRYSVFPISDVSGVLSSSITVPDPYSRRIDVFVTEGETYTPPDPNREIRTDEKSDRPPGWTSEGGPSKDVGSDAMKFYDPS
ncbi:MAG: hypothetical protein MK089_08905 [Phycisphaerales bacterium]|nr:hypothetical protein [Phycisphaerales bacterium]